MKKIIAIAATTLLIVSLTACSSTGKTDGDASNGSKPGVTEPSGNNQLQTQPLDEIMNTIIKDVDNEMKTETSEITSDRFSWYFGIDAIEGAEGIASDAMIGSIAHSIAILRLPEGANVDEVAADIENKIDPRKWICVEAEKTIVKTKGNIIVVIMSFEDIADAVAAKFDSI